MRLEYEVVSSGSNSTGRVKINWVFIGVLMSFFAILFTFDAIAGERRRGTLSLILSNTVSRGQVVLGKYLGAFVTLMVPLVMGVLINLLIILLIGSIPFDSADLLRILGIVGLFALHISVFIFLGLFFSSRVSNAITSLVWLLLTWVCLAFVFPSLLGTFVSNLNPIPSIDEISMRRQAQLDQIENEWQRGSPKKLKKSPSLERISVTRLWAEYFTAINNSVLSQVGLLVLFNLLFFILAQVSFLMSEVK